MSLNKMVQGVNYDTTTLRENVNGLIDSDRGFSIISSQLKQELFGNVVNVTAGAFSSDLSNVLIINSNQDRFSLLGGSPIVSGSDTVMKSSTVGVGNTGFANAYSLVNAIEFNTSATLLRFRFYVGGGIVQYSTFRLCINGIYNNTTPLLMLEESGQPAGSNIYIDINTSSLISGNGSCHVRLEIDGGVNFKSVSYGDGEVWASPKQRVKCVAYADSFGAYGGGVNGSNPEYYPINNMFARAIRMIGAEPTCSAVGGTGYTNNGGTNYTLSDTIRLDDLSLQDFDVVIAPASINDGASEYEQLVSAQLSALQGIRARLPTAFIIVTSVMNETVATTLGSTEISRAAKEAFDSLGDQNSKFIDASGWITEENKGLYIDSDGTHPSHAGESYLAEKLASAILN